MTPMAYALPVVPADEASPPDAGGVPEPTSSTRAPGVAATTAPAAPVPTPTQTRAAGREAFTGADVTASCGA
ncbi:hypothetical protein [Cellulomonas chengniuliangii]|uniref:hypothetical protein n=1 Tax=Cellulomonas chengniuliangii TaxID=2968084 RepID=UPI001D0DFE96|nr:hypothetical protein [Cellulomonas chengniuliangii]